MATQRSAGSGRLTTRQSDGTLILEGRYVLLQPLGVGGVGTVFEARDLELDRAVAIKILHRSRRNPGGLDRLAREANAMARINHPNVVQVFDVGHYDGLEGEDSRLRGLPPEGLFVVMELVRGTDLEAWLRVPRPQPRVLDVFVQAARGLAAAHEQGVLHRDFKPSNVLLARDGTARVTDFGLAAACEPSGSVEDEHGIDDDAWVTDSLTKTGLTVGTPAYMAPEQHRGRALDPRTDQYSFFVALAEALYGDRPAQGESLATLLRSKLELDLPRRKGIPRWLHRALRRGLQPEPKHRFASIADALVALERRRGWGRRVPMFAWGGAALACAVAWTLPADPSRAPMPEARAASEPISLPESTTDAPPPTHWKPNRVALADRPIAPGGTPLERQAILATFKWLSDTGPERQDPQLRRERIDAVRRQTKDLGDPALMAEADLFYALSLANAGQSEEAKHTAEQAFRLAEETREHGVAARAASMCMSFQVPYSDPWHRWARQAELQIDLSHGDPNTEMALAQELGFAAMDSENWEEALLHWQRVLEIGDASFGRAHPGMASALGMIAHVHGALEQPEQEVEALRGSLEIMLTVMPEEHEGIADTRVELGLALMDLGAPVEAVDQVEQGLELLEGAPPSPFRKDALGQAHWAMGTLMFDLGRYEDAIAALEGTVPYLDEHVPYNGMSVYGQIADSYLELGRRREAIEALKNALTFVDADAPEWPERIEIRARLADLEAER